MKIQGKALLNFGVWTSIRCVNIICCRFSGQWKLPTNLKTGWRDFLPLQDWWMTCRADAIVEHLEPIGVKVVTKATQLCTCMRGTNRKRMQTICETTRGKI